MINKNAPINYEFIDRNIRGLVRLLNSLQGVRTMGSCGGHNNPTSIQHPEGSWFVSFWVYKDGRDTTLPMLVRFCQGRQDASIDGPWQSGIQKRKNWYSLYGQGNPGDVQKALAVFIRDYHAEGDG